MEVLSPYIYFPDKNKNYAILPSQLFYKEFKTR